MARLHVNMCFDLFPRGGSGGSDELGKYCTKLIELEARIGHWTNNKF